MEHKLPMWKVAMVLSLNLFNGIVSISLVAVAGPTQVAILDPAAKSTLLMVCNILTAVCQTTVARICHLAVIGDVNFDLIQTDCSYRQLETLFNRSNVSVLGLHSTCNI